MKKGILLFYTILATLTTVKPQDYSGYTRCAEQDSLALVAFYNATGGPDWISNSASDFSTAYLSDDVLIYYTVDYPNAGLGKWLEGPVKNWFGVTLAKRQIGNTADSAWRVIHLHPTLSRRSAGENKLAGYVPKEVGLLTALEWFKVNGNAGLKNTELPDELYQPTILAFDFEGAFFSGILSSALRNCTNLKYPNFRDNYFDSIPVIDFITDPWASLWVYRNQISWATLEPTVAYMVDKGYEYEARDQHDVGRASEIVVAPGSSITLTCNDAGTQGTCTWYKKGFNTYMTGTTYTDNNVTASDTGNYTVVIANEYIRLNDANADYVNTFTKPIHVTFVPSVPVVKKAYTSYSGNTISLSFSKPMVTPLSAQTTEFTVTRNGASIPVNGISRTGRLNEIITLELAASILKNDVVTLSYTKGTVTDVNGGALDSFAAKAVTNIARETPTIVSAITNANGESIILEFDHFMDPATFNANNFTISATTEVNATGITLLNGDINTNISKKIALNLDGSLNNADIITVTYQKGDLTALYGAALQSFSDFPVENIVSENKVSMNLKVVDGTGLIGQVVVKGDMKNLPFPLFDDGTNGDETSGDHTWTINLQLNDGSYDWEVYNQIVTITYDTVVNTDPITGVITYTITPVQINNDSLISGTANLNLSVSYAQGSVTGDTVFNYRTNSVTLILDMKEYLAANEVQAIEPYLMGINNDWSTGMLMTATDENHPDSSYITTAKGYLPGETIIFNFRNGNTWENNSPMKRSHTVVANDTVWCTFGQLTDIPGNSSAAEKMSIYPNPVAGGFLWISLPNHETIKKVNIYTVLGQKINTIQNTASPMEISSLKPGIYFLEVTDHSDRNFQSRFIKK
ncbi:MAG TPA: hypothetical protein DCQ26_14690 [Marinilabiliales bacterium]|nr:MAG: hypothetical protein A2W95_12085 [Bacteroidetes bacterium GWA2_40_14]OFX72429.1 MAG: hypothetical protein A2W96_05225 [Bacteroidetes bacterium GWD2_40_43]OFX95294.1 MAG: hypothetical protein A2W97_07055 [Bacteroidetes bacterium GWE2_40_63]OFY21846.1 MAG: hypothetical protein A2W88_13100 [Bacteroidetes bacterium GWF2_40_13]OFZ26143.1 MAG: hypothetical protein A2437_02345 [Bacteroidetes bacterium RIFOXYC2_FULL_40_12]HAM99849.1 hypothetical protein [Marinilabiliales bacterium]